MAQRAIRTCSFIEFHSQAMLVTTGLTPATGLCGRRLEFLDRSATFFSHRCAGASHSSGALFQESMDLRIEPSNHALQPTPVGVVSSAHAGHVIVPAWL